MIKYLSIPIVFLLIKFLNIDISFLSEIQFYFFTAILFILSFIFRKQGKVVFLVLLTAILYFSFLLFSVDKTKVLVEELQKDNNEKYRIIFTLNANKISKGLSFVNSGINNKYLINGSNQYLFVYEIKNGKQNKLFSIPAQPFDETSKFIVLILSGLQSNDADIFASTKIYGKWRDTSHKAYPYYYLGLNELNKWKKNKSEISKKLAIKYLNYGLKYKFGNNQHLYRKIKNCLRILGKN